jgi:uncharacterized membrane protein
MHIGIAMSLTPLLAAPAVIQLHAFAALAALGLGVAQIAAPKGTLPHRALGWAWVGLMGTVALSSFWITGLAGQGRWSWIHLISAFTLLALVSAVRHARRGNIRAHRIAMLALFAGALVVTGGFTLLPGRIMGTVVFGG